MLGCLVGLIYIYQEYKASIWLWLTGIIMPVIYMFVYYEAGLYADFGMQIYYTLAAIYGFLYWKFGPKKGGEGDSHYTLSTSPGTALHPCVPPALGRTVSCPHPFHQLYRPCMGQFRQCAQLHRTVGTGKEIHRTMVDMDCC